MLERLISDVRYACRSLSAAPAFSAVAVVTLALGIGANTAIFTVLQSVLLAPLPYAEPERVAMVWSGWVGFDETWVSEPEVLDYRGTEAFESLGAFTYASTILGGDGRPARLTAGTIEAEVFEILDVEPQLGRVFTAEEDVPGGERVVVLGHALWRERFGADPAVVGRRIVLNEKLWEVVGVMSPEFRLPLDFGADAGAALWTPLRLDAANPGGRGSHYLYTVARLAPGATIEGANEQLRAITARLTEEGHYSPESGFFATAVPVARQVLGDIRPVLLVLAAAVGFVLLIACTNVANLLLARGQSRAREVAVRCALGASSGRIVTLVLAESLLLALVGGALGVAVASAALEGIVALDPGGIPRFETVRLSTQALGFTLGLSLLTAVVFGAIPALRSARHDLRDGLHEGGRGSGSSLRTERLRQGLVVAQVAFAVVLVVGAALTLRSFRNLAGVDVGFDTRDVLTLQLYLPEASYESDERVVSFYGQLLERVRALPGVAAAGLGRNLPLDATIGDWTVTLEHREPPPGTDFDGEWQVASAGYFEAMGMRLLQGRHLADTDRPGALPVVVVNRRMAEEYWPEEGAVGRRLKLGGRDNERPWATVVGVVENVRHNALTEPANRKFYAPYAQWPQISGGSARRTLYLTARAERDAAGLVGPIRSVVESLDPALPVSAVRTYDDIRSTAMARPRLAMALLTAFGLLALGLAALGVYGVVAYTAARRAPELGLRVALGASAGDIAALVLGRGLAMVGLGIVLGAVAAALATRALESLLYGVGALDAASFAATPAILLAVGVLASLLPALRAARVQPIEALRAE